MPFIANFAEFSDEQHCRFIAVEGGFLFENGSFSNGSTHHEGPPEDDELKFKRVVDFWDRLIERTQKFFNENRNYLLSGGQTWRPDWPSDVLGAFPYHLKDETYGFVSGAMLQKWVRDKRNSFMRERAEAVTMFNSIPAVRRRVDAERREQAQRARAEMEMQQQLSEISSIH